MPRDVMGEALDASILRSKTCGSLLAEDFAKSGDGFGDDENSELACANTGRYLLL